MKLKDAIKSEHDFDKMLCVLDAYIYGRYKLKLKSNELEILKSYNKEAIRELEGKIYYKGHEIERIDN